MEKTSQDRASGSSIRGSSNPKAVQNSGTLRPVCISKALGQIHRSCLPARYNPWAFQI